MDKVTLNKEQLFRLIGFIEKRGFHTPLVIVEILDHFACKVEEKMKAGPKLTLDEAMAAAHYDFGVMGFAPIATAFEANVKKKYKTIYRDERKKVLANPVYVLVALLTAFLFYKGYNWAEMNNYRHLFGFNDVAFLLYLAMLTAIVSVLLKFKPNRKQPDPIIAAIIYRDWWVFMLIVGISFQPGRPGSARGLMFISVAGTIAAFCFVICMFTMYAAMKKRYKESLIVHDYFKSIQE